MHGVHCFVQVMATDGIIEQSTLTLYLIFKLFTVLGSGLLRVVSEQNCTTLKSIKLTTTCSYCFITYYINVPIVMCLFSCHLLLFQINLN